MAKSTSKLFESETPTEMNEDALNLPEEHIGEEGESPAEVAVVQQKEDDDIQDIDLSAIRKKRFRVNGDSNKILELNTSDLNITTRLQSAYERLNSYMDEVGKALEALPDNAEELTTEQEKTVTDNLKDIDAKMRTEIDYIFDAPVSDICCDDGSMYDPFNGMFRFEHIIEAVLKLYERNLDKEFNAMRRRVSAKTSKYTKKYHN